MEEKIKLKESLLGHFRAYPKLLLPDLFKYLYQSFLGCGHIISSEGEATAKIREEYEGLSDIEPRAPEGLFGNYARVHLSVLSEGLAPETLGRMLYLSALPEPRGGERLLSGLRAIEELISEGELPFTREELDTAVGSWELDGYGAPRHSERFHSEYRPAYRVISKHFASLLPLFSELDRRLRRGRVILAIEGGSASGKTTLAEALFSVYGCSVFHMDDFFLRPEQRTPERYAEVGGNVDRERFLSEVLLPLSRGDSVRYAKFNCGSMSLEPPVTVKPGRLTVVEGAYSMHPELRDFYDFSVFLDIDEDYRRRRINKRNAPEVAKRFFEEWIPLEAKYFSEMQIKEECDTVITVSDSEEAYRF